MVGTLGGPGEEQVGGKRKFPQQVKRVANEGDVEQGSRFGPDLPGQARLHLAGPGHLCKEDQSGFLCWNRGQIRGQIGAKSGEQTSRAHSRLDEELLFAAVAALACRLARAAAEEEFKSRADAANQGRSLMNRGQ